jgi:hypothetical protein
MPVLTEGLQKVAVGQGSSLQERKTSACETVSLFCLPASTGLFRFRELDASLLSWSSEIFHPLRCMAKTSVARRGSTWDVVMHITDRRMKTEDEVVSRACATPGATSNPAVDE